MANQYKTGVKLEREIINLLKRVLNPDKYTIVRTAGSHSPVDVIVMKHRTREFCGIQCKSSAKNFSDSEIKKLKEEYEQVAKTSDSE